MATPIVYPNAPITEAVLDIRVLPRSDLRVEDLARVADRLRDAYPTSEEQYELQTQLKLQAPSEPPATVVAESKVVGIVAKNATDRSFQAQISGLNVSKLRPYKDWADFKSEARRIWLTYREVAEPQSLARIALRYINRIDIAGTRAIELKDYFNAYVQLPSNLKQPMSNFFLQVHIPQVDLGGMCIINSAGLPPSQPGMSSVLLDIDVVKRQEIPQSEDELWAFFDRLRDRKNEIFEACITDRARELFR